MERAPLVELKGVLFPRSTIRVSSICVAAMSYLRCLARAIQPFQNYERAPL